jgi:hypothetical protein
MEDTLKVILVKGKGEEFMLKVIIHKLVKKELMLRIIKQLLVDDTLAQVEVHQKQQD